MRSSAVVILVALLSGCASAPVVREVMIPCAKRPAPRAIVAAPAAGAPFEAKAKQLAVYAEEADKYIARLETELAGCAVLGDVTP